MDLLHTLLETCTALTRRVEHLEQDKIAQTLEITKLKQRVKKLERRNKLKVSKLRRLKRVRTTQMVDISDDIVMVDVSKQERIIAHMDVDIDVTLKDAADIAKEVVVDAEIKESADDHKVEPAELQEVMEIVTTAKLMTKVVTTASATITAATTSITTAAITTAPSAARMRKGVIKEKEDNVVMRDQALKRKPQTEAQARKNMMIYLRNMAGFKMDYFKGMSYDDIRLIFEKKFNSNVEELKRHLQIVQNDEDDVYTEATPLARKVHVVNYEIYTEKNKPYYKIIRGDGSPQLFLSFLSLLRNFDREDLE
nr:hypothetical protein [Tanacetum cinerariifolium]